MTRIMARPQLDRAHFTDFERIEIKDRHNEQGAFYENWLDRKIENNGELIDAYYHFLEFGKNNKYKLFYE